MPIDDLGLVAKLRKLVSLDDASNGGPYGGYAAQQCMASMAEAAAAIERLLAERDEARKLQTNMAEDWLSFCENMCVQFDTQEAVASRLIADQDAAEAQRGRLKGLVEQAFRDGMIYGNNVTVTDPDEAWRTSRARQALEDKP